MISVTPAVNFGLRRHIASVNDTGGQTKTKVTDFLHLKLHLKKLLPKTKVHKTFYKKHTGFHNFPFASCVTDTGGAPGTKNILGNWVILFAFPVCLVLEEEELSGNKISLHPKVLFSIFSKEG